MPVQYDKPQFSLDLNQLWKMLPKRMPGRVEQKWRNLSHGTIKLLIPVIYPDGSELSSIFSRELLNYKEDELVVFEYGPASQAEREKRRQPHLIEAHHLNTVSDHDIDDLEGEYLRILGSEIKRQLSAKISEIEEQRQEIIRKTETDIENMKAKVAKDLSQREQAVVEKETELETRQSTISSEVEGRVTIELAQRRLALEQEDARLRREREELDARSAELDQRESRLRAERQVFVEARTEFELKGGQAYIDYVRSLENMSPSSQAVKPLTGDLLGDLRATTITSKLDKSGYYLGEELLVQTLLALISARASGQFVILSGPTGVGKTQLVKRLAGVTGAGYGIVSVRPNWVEPTDLFGFYNAMHRIYEPMPFVDHLLHAQAHAVANRLYCVCLDEMNLSRVENYAADLLSKLELVGTGQQAEIDLFSSQVAYRLHEEEQELLNREQELTTDEKLRLRSLTRQSQAFSAKLRLPPNLVLFGTVNVDETTQMFSPKFMDRAYVLRFPPVKLPKKLSDSPSPEDTSNPIWPVPLDRLDSFLSNLSADMTKGAEQVWGDFLEWQESYFSDIGVHFGFRFAMSFRRYMIVGLALGFDETILGDYFFQAKILPRLYFGVDEKIHGSSDTSKLSRMEEWMKKLQNQRLRKYKGLTNSIEDMAHRAISRGMFEYWD